MKKLVIVFFAVLLYVSCEPATYCWKCNHYSDTENLKIIDTSIYCDMTEDDIYILVEDMDNLGIVYGCSITVQ